MRTVPWIIPVALLVACAGPEEEPTLPFADAEVREPITVPDHLTLPDAIEAFAPSHARRLPSDAPNEEALLGSLHDVERCAPCHGNVVDSWRHGPHARSSFDNPWYLASVQAFREARGNESSRMCAGCHDPVLLFQGRIEEEVEPMPQSVAGVPCMVCHGIENARPDGNGSYELRIIDPLIPNPSDAASIEAHVDALRIETATRANLCGSCHRSFAGREIGGEEHLPGIDDFGHWLSSPYSGARSERVQIGNTEHAIATGESYGGEVQRQDCVDCHMRALPSGGDFSRRAGWIRSHSVLASHSPIAEVGGAPRRDEVRQQLEGAIRLFTFPGAIDAEGNRHWQVVVENHGTGHNFPGGTRDLQSTRVIAELVDSEGRILSVGGSPILRAGVVRENGELDWTHFVHEFAGSVYDRTIPSGASRLFEFISEGELPEGVELRARVVHQKHPEPMRALACEVQTTARGQAFREAAAARHLPRLDACASPAPRIVASATMDAAERASADRFEAWLALGRALSDARQERLQDARRALLRALEFASGSRAEAAVYVDLARVEARLGRMDEMLAAGQEAQRRLPGHPAATFVQAAGLARVWRFEHAQEVLGARRIDAMDELRRNRLRALITGSLDQNEAALVASSQGLELFPRNTALLRTQALSARALEHDEAAEADAAFAFHRGVEGLQTLRDQCRARSPECAAGLSATPTVRMRASPPR